MRIGDITNLLGSGRINLHDGLWALPFTAALWMGWHCAGCSIARFTRRHCRNISVRIMIPLYRFHQWQANLRVLAVQEIKTVPYVPLSHPFLERLIGTIRREYLDQTLFWTAADLENKLRLFQDYFNRQRVRSGLGGRLPDPEPARTPLNFSSYRWQQHCPGLYQTPIAA